MWLILCERMGNFPVIEYKYKSESRAKEKLKYLLGNKYSFEWYYMEFVNNVD